MKFVETLKALPLSRQIMLAAAVAGVVLAMTFMMRGAFQEPMVLLYSGLDSERAGEIIDELEQRDVNYEFRRDAVFVPASARDRIRMDLAKEGLPRPSVKGYELLDDVNGFSVTSEMYKASYWRAKEGELTRTILSIPGVASARVHIGANLQTGFRRSQAPPTASVSLSAVRNLSAAQAEAIQYMVALAVPGLNAEDVAVIDTQHGILVGPNVNKLQAPGVIAEDQASAMEQKILSMLEARLGRGNAKVSVAVDVTRDIERVSEVRYDPDSRVMRQRTVNDIVESSTGTTGGAVTIASNLPQQGGAAGGESNSQSSNSTETVAYEVNETRTERERLPGEIKRISIAVLLNETALAIDGTAANAAEIAEQTLREFEQLIASGAGINAARGDVVTVELMPFIAPKVEELIAAPSMMERLIERHFWTGLQVLVLGLVVIALLLGVVRPMLMSGAKDEEEEEEVKFPGLDLPDDDSVDPIDYLKDVTSERQDETAALLQEWLAEERKVAVNE